MNWLFALSYEKFAVLDGANGLKNAKFATFTSNAEYIEFVPVHAAVSVTFSNHMLKIT